MQVYGVCKTDPRPERHAFPRSCGACYARPGEHTECIDWPLPRCFSHFIRHNRGQSARRPSLQPAGSLALRCGPRFWAPPSRSMARVKQSPRKSTAVKSVKKGPRETAGEGVGQRTRAAWKRPSGGSSGRKQSRPQRVGVGPDASAAVAAVRKKARRRPGVVALRSVVVARAVCVTCHAGTADCGGRGGAATRHKARTAACTHSSAVPPENCCPD